MLNNSRTKLAVGMVISCLIIGYAIFNFRWEEIIEIIASVTTSYLLLGFVILIISVAIRIFRWWWLLYQSSPDIRFSLSIHPFLIGAGINSVVPIRLGDLVRIFGFADTLKLPASTIAATLVTERLFDLLTILSLFFIGLFGLIDGMSVPSIWITTATTVGSLALLLIISLLYFTSVFRSWINISIRIFLSWNSQLAEKISSWANVFLNSISIYKSPFSILIIASSSMLTWALEGFVFVLIARSLSIENIGYGGWFAFSLVAMSTVIPSSPAYIGTIHYFAALGIVLYGATWEQGIAFSIVCHLFITLPFLVAGCISIAMYKSVRPLEAMLSEKANS